MKKSSLACLIIFLNALIIYFAIMSLFISSFHSCWRIYENDPIMDPHDWCETEKEFFLGAIRRGFIYWGIVSFFMLIIALAVKEKKGESIKKIQMVQEPIIRQEEVFTLPSTRTPLYPNFCPDCGSKIGSIDQKFCINCGKNLNNII